MTAWETQTPFHIAESGIFPMTVRELLHLEPPEERERALERPRHSPGSEAPGTPELRTLIAATYRDTGPEEILVTTGAIEANSSFFNVLPRAGRPHAVGVLPPTSSSASAPRAIGCDVSLLKLRAEDGFRYDVEPSLEPGDAAHEVIVINTPHNLTGRDAPRRRLSAGSSASPSSVGAGSPTRAYAVCRRSPAASLRSCPADAPPRRRGVSVGTPLEAPGLARPVIGRIAGPAGLLSPAAGGRRATPALSPRQMERRARRARPPAPGLTRISSAADPSVRIPRGGQSLVRRKPEVVSWTPPRGGLLALSVRVEICLELANRLAEKYGHASRRLRLRRGAPPADRDRPAAGDLRGRPPPDRRLLRRPARRRNSAPPGAGRGLSA